MSTSILHLPFILSFLAVFVATCNAQTASSSNTTHDIVFPKDNEVVWRTLSSSIHLLGVSVLAYCIARRTDKLSARGLTSIPIARWLAILIFADSWLFLFSGGLLISGIGLSLNEHACSAGIFLCIVLYALSKILIYWFLVEKVHLVHPHPSHSRFGSPAYRICIFFVFGYFVVIIISIITRVSFIRNGSQTGQGALYDQGNDGACVIGLGRPASMSVLTYDLLLNVFFTCMFLYPVYTTPDLSPVLKAVAKRTLIAAVVALLTSAINIAVLTAMHGQQLGWICLASCAADVAVNAMAIFAVTASFDDHEEPTRPPTFHEKAASTNSAGRRFMSGLGASISRILPTSKPQLPIAHSASNTSARGILERSNRDLQSADIVSTTRSVRFSPDTTLQSRSFVVTEIREPRDYLDSINQTEKGLKDPSPLASLSSLREECTSSAAGVRTSRLGRKELSDPLQQQPRGRPFTATPLQPVDCSPVDPGEDTSVEVRHEGPAAKKLPRRSSIISLGASSITSRKRSKSVGLDEELCSDVTRTGGCAHVSVSPSHTPSTLEEARDRIHVLSALTEIAGGKKRSAADQSALEVSVVTQTDRRIEQRRRPRNEVLDDYHGRHYVRRGRSFSSSGGL